MKRGSKVTLNNREEERDEEKITPLLIQGATSVKNGDVLVSNMDTGYSEEPLGSPRGAVVLVGEMMGRLSSQYNGYIPSQA